MDRSFTTHAHISHYFNHFYASNNQYVSGYHRLALRTAFFLLLVLSDSIAAARVYALYPADCAHLH